MIRTGGSGCCEACPGQIGGRGAQAGRTVRRAAPRTTRRTTQLGAAVVSGHDRAPRKRGNRPGRVMVELRYEAPQSLQAAVALLKAASGTARVLAGGPDVIVQMETDLIEPQLLVDIKKIAEMRQIVAENGGVRLGAAGPGVGVVNHADLAQARPGGVARVKLVGSIPDKGPRPAG